MGSNKSTVVYPCFGVSSYTAEEENLTQEEISNMKSLCSTCPIIEQCKDSALLTEPFFFWGGLSAKERRRHRRKNLNPDLVLEAYRQGLVTEKSPSFFLIQEVVGVEKFFHHEGPPVFEEIDQNALSLEQAQKNANEFLESLANLL